MNNLDWGWLILVGRGPRRHEVISAGGEPDLRPALEAIVVLAQNAATDRRARTALVEIVKTTPWAETMDRALGLLLPVATKDELCELGRIFFLNFWDSGEEGGGEVMPGRLFRVAKTMEALGDELRDYFPPEEQGNFDYALSIGAKVKQDIPNYQEVNYESQP